MRNLSSDVSRKFLRVCMALCSPQDDDLNFEALDLAIAELLPEHQFDNDLKELMVNAACVTVAMLSHGHPDMDDRLNYLFFNYQGLSDESS